MLIVVLIVCLLSFREVEKHKKYDQKRTHHHNRKRQQVQTPISNIFGVQSVRSTNVETLYDAKQIVEGGKNEVCTTKNNKMSSTLSMNSVGVSDRSKQSMLISGVLTGRSVSGASNIMQGDQHKQNLLTTNIITNRSALSSGLSSGKIEQHTK